MINPLVSIIIPVYNTDQWLNDCLNSVLVQDENNYEILCIDDGSTDNSLSILKSFAAKDSRIHITSQENHGPGYSRNRAIDMASGEYILFLDSDDLLAEGFLSSVIQRAKADETDMLCFDLAPFYDVAPNQLGNIKPARHHSHNYTNITSGPLLFQEMQKNSDYFSAGCLALYRRKWLDDNQIRFPEGIFQEDELFVFHCFLCSQRAGYLNEQGYRRRLRIGSTMTKAKSLIHVRGYYRCASLMDQLCWENREVIDAFPEFFNYILTMRQAAKYIYINNHEKIREETQTSYDLMMLTDLDNYGSTEELKAVYESSSWKFGNKLIQPLHAARELKKKLGI